MDIPTNRGDAAAATWIFRRGHSAETGARLRYTDATADFVADSLRIESSVVDALGALPGAKFERVLHPVFEQDEVTLIAVGCALGGLVGLAQVPLY